MNEETEETKKQQEDEAAKKATGVAAKGVIDFYTGGKGGKLYEAAKKVPGVGKKIDKAEEKVGKQLNQATGGALGKTAKKADNVGALDAADKALSLKGSGGSTPTPGKTASPNMATSPSSSNALNQNIGKKNLNNNGGIVPPSTNPLDEEKAKNENRLQEQQQKNSLRALKNVFMPGGQVTDTLSQLSDKNKKKNDDNTSSPNQDSKENKDDKSPFELDGKFLLKKIIPILLPSLGMIIMIIILVCAFSAVTNQFQDLLAVGSGGNGPDVVGASGGDKELEEMYNRILSIQREYSANGKTFSADLIVAVHHILSSRSDFNYSQMTDSFIREVADYMFIENCSENGCTYSYSESTFKNNLATILFPRYLKASECERAAEEVFEYIKEYKEFYGNNNAQAGGSGTCTYEIPGVVILNSVRNTNLTINNLMVRPLQTAMYGGVDGGVLDNGTLIEFEKYVLGVTLGEYHDYGPLEGAKAQAVAARSFALTRSFDMGSLNGRMLAQENGQWILAILNSVQDQVYCDPDQGCSRDVPGDKQNSQVYSGTTVGPYKYKDPLAEDDPLRAAVNEVTGVVLTDNNDNIINTGFVQSTQKKYKELSLAGLDYVAILLSIYSQNGATKVKQMNCTGSTSNGSYSSWKQTDAKWAGVSLGGALGNALSNALDKTIGKIGCLATSISIQIARSKVQTNVTGEFNPGSFVQAMSNVGGFDAVGNLQWNAVSKVAPNFNFVSRTSLEGKSKAEKLSILTDLVNNGYYLVCEVKGDTGQHWVAVDSINGENITMMDPGSNATNMWSQYDWKNTSAVSYFKVS